METDPLGVPTEYEIDRVWLLAVLDVFTRCVLGYYVVCSPEVSRFDIIHTIKLALQPHARRRFTTPELGYAASGGFPSMVMAELGFACWQWLRLDNAAANLAEDTLTSLSEFVGCHIDAGPPYHPDARPFIERFFGTLERHLGHRLPGTTGSHPKDLRRRLADSKTTLRLLLPEPRRRTLCLLQRARACRVRAHAKSGHRPHISLFGISHTNSTLAERASLIGQRLLIYYDPSDMSAVRAFLADGTELGELKAQGAWGETRHTLKLRQEILRLRRAGQLRYLENASPFEAYIDYHRERAAKNKRSASAVASMRKLQREQRTALPSSPPAPASAPAPAEPPAPATPRKRIVPQRLDIGTGHSYRKAP